MSSALPDGRSLHCPERLWISELGLSPGRVTVKSKRSCLHLTAKSPQARPLPELGREASDCFHNFPLDRHCRSMVTMSLLQLGHRVFKNLAVDRKQKRQAISKPRTLREGLSNAKGSPVSQIQGLSPRKGGKDQGRALLDNETGVRSAVPSASIRRGILYLVVVRVMKPRKGIFQGACHH